MKNILISVFSLVGIALLVWLFFQVRATPALAPTTSPDTTVSTFCPNFFQGQVTINAQVFNVGVTQTSSEQIHGLSLCPELPAQHGLLFPYHNPRRVTFWMKDMLFPIDIVWIKDNQIIGIEKNLPIPASNNTNLPTYDSPGTIDFVLEINAHEADKLGLSIGQNVNIQVFPQ